MRLSKNIDNNIMSYKDYVKKHYETKDVAHDFEHIERIINTTKRIVAYGVDKDIDYPLLTFLQCFHGLNPKLEADSRFKEKTIGFLLEKGWVAREISNAFESLNRHCKLPQRIEEEIVHDANFIEVVGYFGLARAFNSAGARGQSVEEIMQILKSHYYDKVECKTPYGKIVYKERKELAESFLNALKEEIEWYKDYE